MQNQLKQLGENMSDKFVITKVLMSLPEDYKHFISAWESAPDDKQTYDNLVARLLIEEERIKRKAGQRRLRLTFTPEQNGVAERENRILVEAARTMLYAKDLPISLWAESVNTAAYVINRTGKSSIEGKSPYELWSSKSYDINNLKIFGTTVYVHIPKEKDISGMPKKSEVETKRDIVFVNNSPVKPIQQCETINYIEDSVEVPATVEVGAQVEDTSAAGMSSPQSPTMDGDDSQRTMQSDSEGSVYEPSDSDECGEVVRRDVDPKNKRIRKQTVFYNCNNVMLDNCEPKTYCEAMNSPDACKWQEAIQRELKTLKDNNTWSICDIPDNEKVISSKWVFKIKRNNSNIQYKARLVARGLVYKCDDSNLVGFCDADWEGDLRDRKSTTGYCFMYSNCLISWCSKKQSTVSLSSAESEYVAMSMAGNPCTSKGREPDRLPTRTVNVTALRSEYVKSRTTYHSSALSSKMELHAAKSTTLLKKQSSLYTSNVGILPSFKMCSP
ncbi:Retrovirus-related Pol polyprotein from transposon TNT 1-94 [Eumeta japonica]|uniref:Retrovirus-related Pol polyprotein from transposon TNT 1-94 n=1 Tax=Eumeta variegata TaxID=151549 RepID=A0A4C1YTD1_EUMVA|nr:Retrovirus-related Pol polyprotein from transposon TNT 1-94 [Eumeta japonica]